jgi:transcriptional regulator with XRE-family HTH domain
MATIGEELDRAVQGAFTRPIPKSAGAQMRYLLKKHGGRTMPVAELLGISQRTVERYVKNQIKRPRPELADRLEREVRSRAGSRRSGRRRRRPRPPRAAS